MSAGSESAKYRGRRGFVGLNLAWVAWVKLNDVGGMGQNFGVAGVGLRCFVKKVLLKISQESLVK